MKIFRSRQLGSVLLLLIASIAASNFAFDRIPNDAPYNGTARSCSNVNQLFSPGSMGCTTIRYTFQDYGWPFVAIRKADAANVATEFRVHSVAIDRSNTIYISLNTVVIFFGALAIYFLGLRYVWKRFAYTHTFDMPIIQSSDMLDEAGLSSMARGDLAGYSYNLLTNKTGRVMLNITLKANTGIHVVVAGSKSSSSLPLSERIESRFLRPVRLEGDFPEHFHLYCTPGKERELLQLFDPATMARLIDFCREYQLEIFHETLYISEAKGTEDVHDTTTMVADATTLLQKSGATFDRLAVG